MRSLFIISFLFSCFLTDAQVEFSGRIVDEKQQPLAYADVWLLPDSILESTDQLGHFKFDGLSTGNYTVQVSYLGYDMVDSTIVLTGDKTVIFEMKPSRLSFDEIVVTGTKTFKRKTNSPVLVHVLDDTKLEQVQACNLAEGLNFQPGLRVENNCQTCNYTQLRMNGLAGGYSQILINGRPIFSSLTGLYGLEQIPASLISRIEVIRGGGSSLYGSSAIGGTVNVITKRPSKNSLMVNSTSRIINGVAADWLVDGVGSYLSKDKSLGITLMGNHRRRAFYDHNGDNFSELPELTLSAFGAGLSYQPTSLQELNFSVTYQDEYRFGGDMTTYDLSLNEQVEERDQQVVSASLDYQINSSSGKSNLILFSGLQRTNRSHFTGTRPDDPEALESYIQNLPLGTSQTLTYQLGAQVNHRYANTSMGDHLITFGAEFLADDTRDVIPAYRYLIDQQTTNLGVFLQHDWEITNKINLLSGIRADVHNLVDGLIYNPRLALLYKPDNYYQLRLSYGTGFRAPQAFDTDLHIAFAGGGVSRIILDPDLDLERSNSWSLSLNYDYPQELFVFGYTVEGFYTRLQDPFQLTETGGDEFGIIFTKQNGQSAHVTGVTLEGRLNYNRIIQLEGGITFQESEFDSQVAYIDGLPGRRAFIRTPNSYGFSNLSFDMGGVWRSNINYVFTGSMIVPHFAGAINQQVDEYVESKSFHNFGISISRRFTWIKGGQVDVTASVANVLNSYQNDFDIGKNRDSNFVYGPATPRTYSLGLRLQI